ncbi:MAG TPA: type II toxin-antitoxin system prevent-host-death family antitoxin [Stellaceae bacterium]|nr:type II toxin-antitoxin system prevent-host-death family antitoxin [Stellaceae bacterium]
MEEIVSAAEANRNFSRVLRAVRAGRSYLVTAHGKPVARITPVDQADTVRAGARETLLARLQAEPVAEIGRWTRNELYEDGR